MQYIQLQPQVAADVETPKPGNFNYFIDADDNIPKLKDSDNVIHTITTTIIPKPIISPNFSNNQPILNVYFKDINGFNFTDAKLFLFRWRNSRRMKRKDINGDPYFVKKSAGWVHPADRHAIDNFPNSKWFGGAQFGPLDNNTGNHIQISRTTEFSIPTDLIDYQPIVVDLNPNIFWVNNNEDPVQFDGDYTTGHSIIDITTTDKYRISGLNKIDKKGLIQKFCLAVAIPNPMATLQNGLCPMIFGEFSEPFYDRLLFGKVDDANVAVNKYFDIQPLKINGRTIHS